LREDTDPSITHRRPAMTEEKIGTVMHFFAKPMVAAIRIDEGVLGVGSAIHIKGHTTDLYHRVDSMQVDHKTVETAAPGDLVGIGVPEKVREHDEVFKVTE
jgi:putative protease